MRTGVKHSKVGTITYFDGKYNVWARIHAGPDHMNDPAYVLATFGVTIHKPGRRDIDQWLHRIPEDEDQQVDLEGDWTPALVAEYNAMSKRWHTNLMRAGSPRQEAWLRENPVEWTYPESHYTKALVALTEAGLNPDTEYLAASNRQPCDTCGDRWRAHVDPNDNRIWTADHPFNNAYPYVYGTAWLKEELGDDFWDFLERMPGDDTTVIPGDAIPRS